MENRYNDISFNDVLAQKWIQKDLKENQEVRIRIDGLCNVEDIDEETLNYVEEERVMKSPEHNEFKEAYDKLNEDHERFKNMLDKKKDIRKCDFIPVFFISEGVVEKIQETKEINVVHPVSVITNEMNKKEKKAYMKLCQKK